LLSQYQANPRVGHLEALYLVFAYMKSHLDTARLNRRHVAMVLLPPMPVKRDWRLYNMGQCMVECFTMTSCMFTNIQTTCGDRMNCDVAVWLTADRHVSGVESFGSCNCLGSHNF
jgi:hypothetical protein